MRLWTVSKDKQEFDRYKTLVDGSLKHTLTSEALNAALPARVEGVIKSSLHVVAVHDGSDIRKEHSQKLESLGKVRSPSGDIINGYQTFNTVLVSVESKELRLLQSTPYSNGSAEFRSASAVRAKNKERSGLPVEDAIDEETATEADIIRRHLRLTSETVREANAEAVLTHVLDRKHDETALFSYIDRELQDKFVIRLKSSRNADYGSVLSAEGKELSLKLVAMPYKNRAVRHLNKVRLGKRTYQDVRLILDYDTVRLDGHDYGVLRAEYRDRHDKPLFKQPMMLITNHRLTSEAHAHIVFALYGQRARIEEVFHFLKTTLGWEDIQVRDWVSQQALITLCFFIGGYFYEIESALVTNKAIAAICEIGGGKGKVTRTFFLRGLADLMIAHSVQSYFHDNDLDEDEQQAIFAFVSQLSQ